MKTKLLPILLGVLLVMNGILIFLLIKKPYENRRANHHKNFLTEQLNFSEVQKESFRNLDDSHRDIMMLIDEEIRREKDKLFSSFADNNIDFKKNIHKIGALEAKKEAELFRFFSAVREICTEKQVNTFDKIIKKALRGGKRRPPRDGRMPPPKERHHSPPR